MSNIIELNNISKTFDNKKKITVLKNLNFKFKKARLSGFFLPAYLLPPAPLGLRSNTVCAITAKDANTEVTT